MTMGNDNVDAQCVLPPQHKAGLGFYIHVPFCARICPYCDFVKTSRFTKTSVQNYFRLLLVQLKSFLQLPQVEDYRQSFKTQKPPVTVYFGGGTPGLFAADFYSPLLIEIRAFFHIVECTIETNPAVNAKSLLQEYRSVGVDRITLGAQSLCDQALKTLGRTHSARMVLNAIDHAQQAGFTQIQVDLIYGLQPHLRAIPVQQEIQTLHQAGATGVSVYALCVEQRTVFYRKESLGQLLSCEQQAEKEYRHILAVCAQLGWHQWENSCFSPTPPQHNQLYWYGLPYVGLGTGAHGLLPATPAMPFGQRYVVGQGITERAPGDDDLSYTQDINPAMAIVWDEPRTKEHYRQEMILCLIRTPLGIPLSLINPRINEVESLLRSHPRLSRALDMGLLRLQEGYVSLVPEEKLRSDTWAMDICSCCGI